MANIRLYVVKVHVTTTGHNKLFDIWVRGINLVEKSLGMPFALCKISVDDERWLGEIHVCELKGVKSHEKGGRPHKHLVLGIRMLSSRGKIVVMGFSQVPWCVLIEGVWNVGSVFGRGACSLRLDGLNDLLKKSKLTGWFFVFQPAESASIAKVDCADRSECLQSVITNGSSSSVSTTRADPDHSNTIGVNIVEFLKIVDYSRYVGDSGIGVFKKVGHAARFALVGGVEGNSNEALLGESLRISAGGLFLDTTCGMQYYNSWERAVCRQCTVVALGSVQQTSEVIRTFDNIDRQHNIGDLMISRRSL
jgi:hypothetical protein